MRYGGGSRPLPVGRRRRRLIERSNADPTEASDPKRRTARRRHAPGLKVPPGVTPVLELDRLDAVLFDLDGVLTDPASLHAAAWTSVFNELLKRMRASPVGHPGLRPFGTPERERGPR